MYKNLQLRNEKTTTLYLTRHGETEWNLEKRLQGHKDSSLTKRGILQAGWLSEALENVDISGIYTSPSPRTQKTTEIIRRNRTIEIISKDNLREINMGDWEGQLESYIKEHFPEDHSSFWNTPHKYKPNNNGESFCELRERVIPCLQEIMAANKGKKVLIVTHAAALKVIMAYFEGRPLKDLWQLPFLHSTALCKVVVESNVPKIELYGDISHYKETC